MRLLFADWSVSEPTQRHVVRPGRSRHVLPALLQDGRRRRTQLFHWYDVIVVIVIVVVFIIVVILMFIIHTLKINLFSCCFQMISVKTRVLVSFSILLRGTHLCTCMLIATVKRALRLCTALAQLAVFTAKARHRQKHALGKRRSALHRSALALIKKQRLPVVKTGLST